MSEVTLYSFRRCPMPCARAWLALQRGGAAYRGSEPQGQARRNARPVEQGHGAGAAKVISYSAFATRASIISGESVPLLISRLRNSLMDGGSTNIESALSP